MAGRSVAWQGMAWCGSVRQVEARIFFMNTDAIEVSILTAASGEAFHEAYSQVNALDARLKELKQQLEQAAIEHIESNGEFTVGEIKYVVGKDKEVKARSSAAVAAALLEAGGPEALEQCIASNGFKPGATKTVFEQLGSPEQFNNLFDVTYKPRLRVKLLNTKFLKGTNHADQ
jgi:hypothetical protein